MRTTLISRDLSCLTPRKVVKMPERIRREETVPDREGKQINKHPTDIGNLPRCDDDEKTRKTENNGQEDERNRRIRATRNDGNNDQVERETDSSGQDQGTHQLHSYDELHREAKGTTEVADEDKLSKVVNGRIDPTSAL